jgi:phytoene dehydrogenase-like protein
MPMATIIGSGPNGLSAVLAASGVRTTVPERNGQIGGGCSTAEVTQLGFLHDLGSSTYTLGAASPFYGSLPFNINLLSSNKLLRQSITSVTWRRASNRH